MWLKFHPSPAEKSLRHSFRGSEHLREQKTLHMHELKALHYLKGQVVLMVESVTYEK
jgi:hypothetical protein